MENKKGIIHNISKDIVEKVIAKSLINIEFNENMNSRIRPLTPVAEEMDNANTFIPVNEESVLIDVELDENIDLDSIIKDIHYEKAKREQSNDCISMLKRCFCCFGKM